MTAKVSIICLMYRPGGIDLLLQGLRHQEKNYELIVVDDYAGRTERGIAQKVILEAGIPLVFYGPSREGDRKYKCEVTHAMNKGLQYVDTPWVVFCHDYSFMADPKETVKWEKSFEYYGERTLIHGIANEISADRPPDIVDDIDTWKGKVELKFLREWIPEAKTFECFYFGGHIRFFDTINGLDQRGHDCGLFTLTSLVAQANILDYRLVINKSLVVTAIDHRIWGNASNKHDTPDNLWWNNGLSEVPYEPDWVVPSPNPFDLAALRFANRRAAKKEATKVIEEPWYITQQKHASSSSPLVQLSFKNKSYLVTAIGSGSPQWLLESFYLEGDIRDRWWLIKEGDVVVDVGAAYGAYTLTALAQGAQRVFSFEPSKYEYFDLCSNLTLNNFLDRCRPMNCMLGNKISINKDYYTGSHSNRPVGEPEDRLVVTLDSVVFNHNLSRLDWIKIDVEGGELEVLEGCVETLKKFRPSLIIEAHVGFVPGIDKKVLDLLKPLGYCVEDYIEKEGMNDRWYLMRHKS